MRAPKNALTAVKFSPRTRKEKRTLTKEKVEIRQSPQD